MRKWAVGKSLRYKNNDCFIDFTYGLRILNSLPLFAFLNMESEQGCNRILEQSAKLTDNMYLYSLRNYG